MELKNLIETHLDLPRLSKDLDELGHPGRIWSVRHWSRDNLAVLWEAAKGFRPVTLDDFVPPSLEPLVEVTHDGKNSLGAFSHFQKRFCKPAHAEGEARLIGYNHQAMSAITGPGYYTARPSAEPGEVDIDYTAVPSEKPASWPPIAPNSSRLGRFVYAGMIDIMRGISSHVTIGRGRKKGDWMDAWFALVREDREPAS